MTKLIILVIVLYCLTCYGISFAILTIGRIIYPNTHQFNQKWGAEWKLVCSTCGRKENSDDFITNLRCQHNIGSFIGFSPIVIPVFGTAFLIKYGVEFVINTGPTKLANYIRKSFLSETSNDEDQP